MMTFFGSGLVVTRNTTSSLNHEAQLTYLMGRYRDSCGCSSSKNVGMLELTLEPHSSHTQLTYLMGRYRNSCGCSSSNNVGMLELTPEPLQS